MSKIIGINAFGQNPSACLLINGQLDSFSHEERFNRFKGSDNLFPGNAISWCLKNAKLQLSDIDYIAVNWDCNKYPYTVAGNLINFKLKEIFKTNKSFKSNGGGSSVLNEFLIYNKTNYIEKLKDSFRTFGFNDKLPRIEFVDHHLSHAYQSFYQSGFSECVVLVADGHGEENCVSAYLVKNNQFKRILNYKIPYSLGWYYCGFTSYLGFKGNRDEGKFMGLAAYGESRAKSNPWIDRLDKILRVENDNFSLDPYCFKMHKNDYHPRYTNKLVDFITSYDKNLQPIYLNDRIEFDGKLQQKYLREDYIDLAYAVQTKFEDVLVHIAKNLQLKTNQRDICLCGGVFMNCKANGEIFKRSGFENIFIHPASSDDGSSIGAAFYISAELNENPVNILKNVQLGSGFNNDEIRKDLDNCGLKYTMSDNIAFDTAKLLHDEKFVGWFQGRAEMGARALGGRSIIASPISLQVKDRINKQVKYRENWRPYCPSMLFDYKDDYLSGCKESPFMIIASEATPILKEKAPAVVHIDNTVRAQTVKQEDLPLWYNLISEFNKLSGFPVILNTSFNVRSEPIVNTPLDAIRTFYSSGLHSMAIGDFIVEK